MPDWLIALEDNPVADAMRYWRWAYPAVNTGHILGIALLFGAIVPLDLRLIGLWRTIPIESLARVLVPVAATGLGLALATGPLLFLVDPLNYAGLAVFRLKLVLIVLGAINVMMVHRSPHWRSAETANPAMVIDYSLMAAGLISLLVWLLVIVCGRLIAYL